MILQKRFTALKAEAAAADVALVAVAAVAGVTEAVGDQAVDQVVGQVGVVVLAADKIAVKTTEIPITADPTAIARKLAAVRSNQAIARSTLLGRVVKVARNTHLIGVQARSNNVPSIIKRRFRQPSELRNRLRLKLLLIRSVQ
jgi:hypothetical protein